MQHERTTFFPPLTIRNGVLVLDGYGLRVSVERGHLAVSDGIGDERRRGRFAKATCGLKRLALLGHSGFVTLEALRWVHDAGAAVVQIDADSKVIAAWGPVGFDDARLRRSQALATTNGVGMKVARELVQRKLGGQLALLTRLHEGQGSVAIIEENLDDLKRTLTPGHLRLFESSAAAAYWKAWERVPIRFVRRDESRLPDHWRTFGPRGSPLANGPRQAANPANAIVNYLYAVLEGEARIAALAMGLDPGMGVLHADQPGRDSLALDLMEPVRPEVDAYVLDLLSARVFRASDFFETRRGVCRVLPPLTHVLAETATQWAQRIAPVAEWAAKTFAAAPGNKIRKIPTLLTQDQRSAGRDGLRRNPRKATVPTLAIPQACRNCGVLLDRADRAFCEECLPEQYGESRRKSLAAGRQVLARLRDNEQDPAHGGQAAQKRGKRITQQFQARAAWNASGQPEPDTQAFRREILPHLHGVPLTTMARATGLSRGYCSFIRRGVRIPHPRHWELFLRLLHS
jgi:CRISPR-associated endonuclease Cas1